MNFDVFWTMWHLLQELVFVFGVKVSVTVRQRGHWDLVLMLTPKISTASILSGAGLSMGWKKMMGSIVRELGWSVIVDARCGGESGGWVGAVG